MFRRWTGLASLAATFWVLLFYSTVDPHSVPLWLDALTMLCFEGLLLAFLLSNILYSFRHRKGWHWGIFLPFLICLLVNMIFYLAGIPLPKLFYNLWELGSLVMLTHYCSPFFLKKKD